MKKPTFIKILMLPFEAVCLSALLTASVLSQSEPSRQLIVGVNVDYPPFEFIDNNGKVDGYDVDILKSVADVMNIDVKFVPGRWNNYQLALNNGTVNAVAGVLYSEDRATRVAFSDSYLLVQYSVFGRKGSKRPESLSALRDRDVIVEDGSLIQDYLTAQGLSESLVPVASGLEGLRLLSSGKYDYALLSTLQGLTLIKNYNLTNVVQVRESIYSTKLCVAVEKNDDELRLILNEGLNILTKTGRSDKIYAKWFGGVQPLTSSLSLMLKKAAWFGIPVLLLLAGIFGWVRLRGNRNHEKAAASLGSSEAYHLLVRQMTDGVLITDNDGNCLETNEKVLSLLGYTREEVLLKSLNDLVPEDIFLSDASIVSKLHGGEIVSKELRFLTKDNLFVPFEITATIILDGKIQIVLYRKQLLTTPSEHVVAEPADLDPSVKSQTDGELPESELHALFASMKDVVLVLDGDGRYLKVAPTDESLLIKPPDELLGKTLHEVFPQEQADMFLEYIWQTLQDHKTVSAEYELKIHDTEKWFSANISPIDEKSVVWVARDITEKKRKENELRESEEQFRALVEQSSDAIYVLQEDRIVLVNRAWERLFGIPTEEATRSDFDYLALIHPESVPTILDRKEKRKNGQSVSSRYEIKGVTRNRQILDLDVTVADVTWKGRPAIQGIYRDNTDRKQAEKKIREQAALLEHARDAIIVCGLEGHIQYWNKGAEGLYGWSVQEAMGKNCRDLFSDKAMDAAFGAVNRTDSWNGEIRQHTKNGAEIIVQSRWTVVYDSDGNRSSILIISTDITEEKKFEDQFLRAQRLESIGTVAGGIAHDLNNVLAPVLLAVESLIQKKFDEQTQQRLGTIKSNVKRGADLINQVLMFARGATSKKVLLQVEPIVMDIEKITKETFPRSIQIETQVGAGPCFVSADPTQLHQILMNLCVNARDAMINRSDGKPDGGTLSVTVQNFILEESSVDLHHHAAPGRYVEFRVSDTGIGMPQDVIGKIFDPFFTTKGEGKGTGLGLSTVQGIVKSHNGFISVHSEPGKGTDFKFFLPAVTKENEESIAKPEMKPEEVSSLPRGHHELILVVDDEESMRETTAQNLAAYGYRVIAADNGESGISMYKQFKSSISIVLLDMLMPVMDGAATIRALVRINPKVKIITCSGSSADSNASEINGSTVKAFLLKPFTTEALLTALEKVHNEES
jgi:PAS domain S-box-containing protein